MPSPPAGLCDSCRHQQVVRTKRSSFSLCRRWKDDDRYPRYPRLPVLRCPGHEPGAPGSRSDEDGGRHGRGARGRGRRRGRRRPRDRADDGGAAPAAAERWQTLARSTVARTEVAAARIGDGAYVVGGFAAPDGATSAVVERYDLRRNRWARVKPIPQAVNHAAAVAYAGDLYVVGGYTAGSGLADETDALWRYEPAPTAGRGCRRRRRRARRSPRA